MSAELTAVTALELTKDAVVLVIAEKAAPEEHLARIIRKHFQGKWTPPWVQLYFTEYRSYADAKKGEWLNGVVREYYMELERFGAAAIRPIKAHTQGMAMLPWRLLGLVKVTPKQVHTEGFNETAPPFVFNRQNGKAIGSKAPKLTLDVESFEDGERKTSAW